MSGSHDIYLHKPTAEGRSSVNPESPTGEIATSPKESMRGKILLGYGTFIGKRALSTTVQEIAADGNERLATDLNNLIELGTRATLLYATGGLAAIPMAVEGIAQTVTNVRGRNRENKERAIALAEKGVRIGYGGGAYYD